MAKEEGIEVTGTVVEKHPGGIFSIELDNKHKVLAQIAGKLRKHRIRISDGRQGAVGTLALRLDSRTDRLPLPLGTFPGSPEAQATGERMPQIER